jgi:ribosome-associated protein
MRKPGSGPDHDPGQPSKSQRKREHHALQALAASLLEMPEARLRRLELDDRVRQEVQIARGMSASGARNRQLRLITQLLSESDLQQVHDASAEDAARQRAETALQHRAERLRESLLAQGATALSESPLEPESGELLRLRDTALAGHDETRAKHAYREIYRVIIARLRDQSGT